MSAAAPKAEVILNALGSLCDAFNAHDPECGSTLSHPSSSLDGYKNVDADGSSGTMRLRSSRQTGSSWIFSPPVGGALKLTGPQSPSHLPGLCFLWFEVTPEIRDSPT